METKIINTFPGYEYTNGTNMYRGTDLGRGGYIISHPGIYTNVALLDVQSLHPNSIRAMNCFGEYTKNFTDILDARVLIKHKEYDKARELFDGRLSKYLDDPAKAKQLAQALKIAINSVYGLTAASFSNPFRDSRNVNNIVALRGALFMRTLQDEVESRGFKIVAIKTDSIKIANATKEIVDFCIDFAKKYGYVFEFEAAYSKICQTNDADYIAKYMPKETCQELFDFVPGDNNGSDVWTVTGAKFAVPYVFKTLFSKEDIAFDDMCETKSVTSALYLDMNEGLRDVTKLEQELYVITKGEREPERQEELKKIIADNHNYVFVGKVGQFCPIKPGCGGGELLRECVGKDGEVKYASATGAKGYRWLESEVVRTLGKENDIDKEYYNSLVDEAVNDISQYGDFEWFVSDDPVAQPVSGEWFYSDRISQENTPPWYEEEDHVAFDVR